MKYKANFTLRNDQIHGHTLVAFPGFYCPLFYPRKINFSEAIKSYKKTTAVKPKEGLSYVGLGLSLFGNGNSESAIKTLLKANKLFKEKKNISWYGDTRVMIAQVKHFEKFPPHFSNLWLATNLKLVHDTYEKNVFNPKQYLTSISAHEKNDFPH